MKWLTIYKLFSPFSKSDDLRIVDTDDRDPLDSDLSPQPDIFSESDPAVPTYRQNPLLRILKAGDQGKVENLGAPKYNQDPLLRQLKQHPEKFQVSCLS